ncbi:hypothetical protein PRJ39_22190 [Lysobacter enzymogenes]|uniref:hypothetical protein n=1 Tax=Lysobacter enzymogenes TaxID=69 RepID=UPI00374A2E2C
MKNATLLAGLTVVAAVAVGLGACSNAVKDPKYERNPNPRQKYVVTAKVEGAPGPFEAATASVQYVIGPDRQCMPPAEPISGAFPTPDRASAMLPVRKMSGSEFQFDVYLDAMEAKDYFGRGVCDWRLEGVRLTLKPAGTPDERTFKAYMSGTDLPWDAPLVLYARREAYGTPRRDAYDDTEEGLKKEWSATRYGSDLSKLFAITMEARKAGNDH